MAYNATVIAASLDDKELRNSIDSLVQYVNTEIGKMGEAFNSTIARMAQSLRDLGAINLDNLSNVRLETGSIERAKAQKEEADAVLRTKESYDQLAASTKKAAVGVKGDGYVKLQSDVDKDLTYIVNANKDVDAQMALIMQKEQALLEAKQRETQETLAIAQAQQQVTEAVKGTALGWGNVYEMQARANANIRRGGSVTGQTPFQSYDDFRGAIAATLGVQRQSIILANESADSYNRISSSLKQLRDAYNRLSATDRNSDKGKALIATMHEYEYALRRIQTQASRPVNLQAALGLRENTLEDIQYKMQKLAAYRSGLDVNKQKAEIEQVNKEYARLQKRMNEVIGKNNSLLASNNALARSWNYMKNRLAFYVTVGASTQFIKNLIEVRSQYEMNERALGILVNSAERGTQIFNQLSQMSLVSPYTLIELSSAAKQLVAYDVAAKDVVDTTRRLADMASAVGVPIERLTYALGQIKAYGYLNSRDNRMFANAGIPLVKQLADYYTALEGKMISTADVYDRIKKKAVSYNDVMSVINKMTDENGKFFDFQAKMAETLKVRLANLTLAWNNMLNDMGQETQGVLTWTINRLRDLFANWRNIRKAINEVAVAFLAFKAYQVYALANMGALTRTLGWNVLLGKKLTNVFIQMGSALKKLMMNPATYWAALAIAIADVAMSFTRAKERVKEFNEELAQGAKESANTLDKYLGSSVNRETRDNAKLGKLSQDAGEKAWENISEQIETSSQSASQLITKLSKIPDINERVSVSFDYLEKMRSVDMLLQDIDKDTFTFTQDKWHGFFGEGLVSDLSDYAEVLNNVSQNLSQGLYNKDTAFALIQPQLIEFRGELMETSLSIKKFLDEHQIKDPDQIAETLERVRTLIKQKNPEIKGEIANLFDVELDKQMFELTDGAINKNASLWRIFMDELKRTSSHAFQGLTEDIFDESQDLNTILSAEAMRAINDNLQKFRLTMPFYVDAIEKMVKDASQLRINIGVAFGLSPDTKTIYERLKEADSNADEAFSRIERLQQRQAQLAKKGGLYSTDLEVAKESQKLKKELERAQTDYNDAIEQGGKSKKENTKATKAQHQAESELQKALKDEISLLDKARSTYKSLTKDGVSSTRAIEVATSGYEDSLAHINAVLRKYGVAKFDIKKYVGTANPRDMRDALQAQLDTLKNLGVAKPAEIKDLEVKLKDLNVDSLTFDQKTLTESLNNELNKIKESYEFAVELDADPELGGIFLDTLGISKEELAELPKTAAEVARLAQAKINEELAKNDDTKNLLFNLDDMLNRTKFTEWVEVNGHTLDDELTKQLQSYVDYVNKLRLDETKKTIQEWDKLLDKYAEYETKRKRIMEEAQHEREVAQRKNAPQEIFDAINQRERRDLAKVDFERFQETPTWITATGDLARLSDNALGLLIERIREYKKNAKDLDPKQIKQLNRALSQLYKEQRKDNPFSVFADAYDQAKERFNDYQVAIDETEAEIEKLRKKEGTWTMEESARYNELIDTLRKLRKEQEAVSEISVVDITKGFQAIAQLADNAAGQIKEMADALGGSEMADGLKQMADLFGKAASMAVTGAQIGGAWGAVAGAAVGLLSGIITTFGNEFSGNASITRKVEASELAVRRLESASKDLERALDKAYGVGTIGAQNLIVLNRKLQLVELERQLALEKSRKEKNKDKDKIMEIEDKIKDIKFEIEDMLDSITNDLLGISSVGDAVESMVDAITDALRGGEDAIEAFNESVDDMIINLVKKFVQTKYLAPIMEDAWAKLNAVVLQRTAPLSSEVEMLEREKAELQARYDYYDSILSNKKDRESNLPPLERKLEEYDRKIEEAKARLVEASMPTDADLNQWIGILDALKLQGSPIIEMYRQLLDSLGLGSTSSTDTELSALQQGIQGITETTANALEAYMNGVLQQVYLHSTLLTEIRDFLIPQDGDIQLSVQAQMLLQLQQSYQVQQSIQNILENWNNASGQAVRVELVA